MCNSVAAAASGRIVHATSPLEPGVDLHLGAHDSRFRFIFFSSRIGIIYAIISPTIPPGSVVFRVEHNTGIKVGWSKVICCLYCILCNAPQWYLDGNGILLQAPIVATTKRV